MQGYEGKDDARKGCWDGRACLQKCLPELGERCSSGSFSLLKKKLAGQDYEEIENQRTMRGCTCVFWSCFKGRGKVRRSSGPNS